MHGLQKFIDAVEKDQMKKDLPELKIGMTVKVGVTVVEGNKTRVQPYQGLIIAMHKHALNSTITVRKTFQGVGVERVFPVHSPLITVEPVVTAGVPRVRAQA
jgi:large subunit ribosomal protein L19